MTTRHGPKPLFFVFAVALVCSGGFVWAAQQGAEGLAAFPSREVVRAVPCASGGWDVLGRFSGFVAKDVGVNAAGDVLVIGESTAADGTTRLAILRLPAVGTGWERVDEFVFPGAASATGYRIHVAADGWVYALGLSWLDGQPLVLIRMSDQGGVAGSWRTAARVWPRSLLGAIGSDGAGRVYVALGFAGPDGIGWDVESAVHAQGLWRRHDRFVITPALGNGAVPYDLEVCAGGKILVSGQINGNPDLWITRLGGVSSRPRWRTIDLYTMGDACYGLAATSVLFVNAADGQPAKLVVAGFGVAGGGEDAYHWMTRESSLEPSKGELSWENALFQLEADCHCFALDAESDPEGRLLVLGVAGTAEDSMLLLRHSWDRGASWEDLATYPGIARPLDARLAVSGDGTYFAIANEAMGAVVLGCAGS